RNQNKALVHERLRLFLHVRSVATSPAAAVNPDHDREILALGRGVNIEHLPFVLRLGVWNATLNLRLVGEGGGGEDKDEDEDEDEEESEDAHGSLQRDFGLFILIGRMRRSDQQDHSPAPTGGAPNKASPSPAFR